MPEYREKLAHYVLVTGIVVKDGKYLISKRAENEPNFPGYWTVPGGKLETTDYMNRDKDTTEHWYNVLEDLVRREVREEVGVEIKNINYVTSLVYVRSDGVPAMIISLYADWASGEVVLEPSMTEYKWVNIEEAKNFQLIEGIYEELEMLDRKLHGGDIGTWKNDKASELELEEVLEED
jgi:8-oxo-dGTP diphosphatase